MRRLLVSLVGLAMVAAFTACGDDEERLTADEFREQANAICERGNERLDEEAEEIFGNLDEQPDPDSEESEEFFEFLVDDVQGQIDDVGELEPPEDLESDVEEFLDSAQEDLDSLEEGGPEAAFSDEEDPFEGTNELAEELGLTECAG